jgi:hypothetical protein
VYLLCTVPVFVTRAVTVRESEEEMAEEDNVKSVTVKVEYESPVPNSHSTFAQGKRSGESKKRNRHRRGQKEQRTSQLP